MHIDHTAYIEPKDFTKFINDLNDISPRIRFGENQTMIGCIAVVLSFGELSHSEVLETINYLYKRLH
tara:strand:+ start:755 stop:955 length:201 start_codon:yes stop_codon:yes gene_type:complete